MNACADDPALLWPQMEIGRAEGVLSDPHLRIQKMSAL